jgi:hypothetical protein
MSKFAPPAKEIVKPARVVVVPLSAWAYNYKLKPKDEVAIGLRLISEREVQVGKAEASKYMLKMYGTDGALPLTDIEKAYECWDDAFLAYVVGRSACDPNDCDKQYFPFAQDDAKNALTSEGLRLIWDEYMLAARGTGERAQIREDELLVLARSLVGGGLSVLDTETLKEARKHLAWVYEVLGKADGLLHEEEDEGGYVVRAVEAPEAAAAPAS